ncbi:hypothetical protein PENSPDRAFT_654470 [Peniophora sp. CONT]|nr:hypothetical protein PENSPDRAFT_654470 [Peniophora sp. CONT]
MRKLQRRPSLIRTTTWTCACSTCRASTPSPPPNLSQNMGPRQTSTGVIIHSFPTPPVARIGTYHLNRWLWSG